MTVPRRAGQLRITVGARRHCRLALIDGNHQIRRGSVLVSEGGQFLLSLDNYRGHRGHRGSNRPKNGKFLRVLRALVPFQYSTSWLFAMRSEACGNCGKRVLCVHGSGSFHRRIT